MDPNQTEIWTIMRLIAWGADYFKSKRVDSPRLTMELLISHILGLSRFELYMQFDRPLNETELVMLRSMVRRRAAREPLQYILGEAGFHRRRFHLNNSVLIPRPETELLVEETLRRVGSIRCLDVGTGSGCIGITIALERPETEVVAIDTSEGAIEVARRNAIELGARNISLQVIDFFDTAAMRELGSFDLIVSNPPYISATEHLMLEPEVRDHEPRLALTDDGDGLAFYRRFIELAPMLLRRPGNMFLELGYDQSQVVVKMFREAGMSADTLTDFDRVERILWGEW